MILPDAKPLLLSYLVDAAQIVSAIATAAAVIVAIWLARRGESQRPKFFVGRRATLTIGPNGSPAGLSEHELSLTIVNAGIVPVVVRYAHLIVTMAKKDSIVLGLGSFDAQANSSTFPVKLEHGEEVTLVVPIKKGERPWNRLPALWWVWKRPEFRITSSLGKTYRIKPSRRLLYTIKRECL